MTDPSAILNSIIRVQSKLTEQWYQGCHYAGEFDISCVEIRGIKYYPKEEVKKDKKGIRKKY